MTIQTGAEYQCILYEIDSFIEKRNNFILTEEEQIRLKDIALAAEEWELNNV